jgi:chromosome partitioning protein
VLVLSVLSLKGGVGKTSFVLGLAGAALERGVPTLVVDVDPQANASMALGVGPGEVTAADVLDDPRQAVVNRAVRSSGWLDAAAGGDRGAVAPRHGGRAGRAGGEGGAGATSGRVAGPSGVLDVLVGDETMLRHDLPDPTPAGLRRLGTGLSRLNRAYDLVLIDCPPSLGRLTRSALVAAHRALVVTEPSLFAVHAADRAFRAVQQERAHNAVLQPLGVVVNRYHERSPEHRFRLNELRTLFGPLVLTPPLPDRSAIQQAQGMAMPVQDWHTPGAREAATALRSHLARVLRAAKGHRR